MNPKCTKTILKIRQFSFFIFRRRTAETGAAVAYIYAGERGNAIDKYLKVEQV